MNYQQPLLNLVTKGHLNVKNPIGMQKFIECLDNDSCQTILENLLFRKDASECARILDEAKEAFELATNTRIRVSESTLNNARDKILCEDMDADQAIYDTKQDIHTVVKMLKFAGPAGVAMYLLKMKPPEREQIMGELKLRNQQAYDLIRSNPLMKQVMPENPGFISRAGNALWKFDYKNASNSPTLLNRADKQYLSKIGHGVGNAALLAAGIVTGIVAINVLYKEVFSYEAKKCKGLAGKKRTICMSNAIIEGSERAKKKAEDMLVRCDAAKDPQDCRYKMKVEIRSWTRKIEEQQRKLVKLQSVNKSVYPPERPADVSTVAVNTASDPFGSDSEAIPTPVTVPETPKAAPVAKPAEPKVEKPKAAPAPKKKDPFGDVALTNPFA